jgi:hypothetical protein
MRLAPHDNQQRPRPSPAAVPPRKWFLRTEAKPTARSRSDASFLT